MTEHTVNDEHSVVLITGAAVRIGAACVRLFHAQGYRVLLHYRRSRIAAEQLADELNSKRSDSVRCLQADLLDLKQIEHLAANSIAQWGSIDALINNASGFFPVPLAELTNEKWQQLNDSNAKAPLFLCKHLHHMLRRQHGCIVNILDSTALHGVAGFAPYTMAKAALANMTHTLARELAPEVRVNGIAPGVILWPEYNGGVSAEEQQIRVASTALQRMGTPEEIAHATLFLVRDASYITGQVINVDGGATIAL
jgi:pteridine reductase